MYSFDVENLFTNIPVHDTINIIIIDKLFTRDDSTIVGLGKKLFRSLLELTVTTKMVSLFLILNFINKLEVWAWANRWAQPSQLFLCIFMNKIG